MLSAKIKASSKYISFLLLLLNTQLITGQRVALANNSLPKSPGNAINTLQVAQADKPQAASAICPAQLEAEINKITGQPKFSRSRWGILIETLSPARTLYSRDAQSYFLPASNLKLITTAAALHQLGSQYQIRTSIYGNDTVLRLVGRGDPSFKNPQLTELAQQIKRQGLTQVKQLIVDDSYFKGQAINPTWAWDDLQFYYGAPINSLILNENAAPVTLTPQTLGQPLKLNWADPLDIVGLEIKNNTVTSASKSDSSVDLTYDFGKPVLRIAGQLAVDAEPVTEAMAVINPSERFLRHLRRALVVEGITVTQGLVASSIPSQDEREIAFVKSPPLATLVMETNQNSNNLYAEALLRSLGASSKDNQSDPQTTTSALGLATIKNVLTQFGVNPDSYVIKDGSGLSRHNLVTPETLVQTLRTIANTPVADVYKSSLPVAGISGTLKNRFRNTPAQGIVRAKTGTLSGMSALSGYIDVPNYQPLAFSIIVNQSNQPAPTIRQAIDDIVLLLTRIHRC